MEKLINNFKISFTKGDTYALAIKFKSIAEDLRTAYFTVKENPDDSPLIQKSLGMGIEKIDDREYKNEKTYKVQIQAGDTINLEANVQYLYDLQVTIDNVVKTVLSGVFVVNHSVTGVTSTTTQTLDVAVDDEIVTEILTTPATNGIEYEQDPVANAKIGDMAGLSTLAKETLVKAINEVKNDANTVSNEVYKIKNGTITVPKAEQSANADNAKDYTTGGKIHTKFTEIDERLNAMGFNQGVAEYSDMQNVTVNSLKKQGKYVIFSFAGEWLNNNAHIIIPQEFRPAKETEVFVFNKTYYGNSTKYPLKPDGLIHIAGEIEIVNAGWETE
jgi:hypothetical protein